MAKLDKLLKKWKTKIPTEARKSEVILVLNHYFPGQHGFAQGGSSHIVIESEKLNDFNDITINGIYSIPVYRGGHYVKGGYIKNLIELINRIEKKEEQS